MSRASVLVALDDMPGSYTAEEVKAAVSHQMAPFDENDAGEWFGDGTRWDWWIIGGRFSDSLPGGAIVRRSALTLEAWARHKENRHRQFYRDYATKADSMGPEHGSFVYGFVFPGGHLETEDQCVARLAAEGPSCYAFLRNRVWHEGERMGWFGSPAATECEMRGADVNVCLYRHTGKYEGARILNWSGGNWGAEFWRRHIERLPGSTLLVVVDYHV